MERLTLKEIGVLTLLLVMGASNLVTAILVLLIAAVLWLAGAWVEARR